MPYRIEGAVETPRHPIGCPVRLSTLSGTKAAWRHTLETEGAADPDRLVVLVADRERQPQAVPFKADAADFAGQADRCDDARKLYRWVAQSSGTEQTQTNGWLDVAVNGIRVTFRDGQYRSAASQ